MKRRREKLRFSKKTLPLFVMMLPGLLYLLINNYIPMFGIFIAFKDINYSKGIFGSDWTGLSNFRFLFENPDFYIITRNTILYNLAFLVINTVAAVAIAIFLNEIRRKIVMKTYQTIILLPYLISMVIVSYICYGFFNTETGFINNSILEPLGIEGISWYSSPDLWIWILPIVNLWKNAGYLVIIYFASIIGIDRTYYEAARIDGAGKFAQIKCITLPLLRPTIITMTILAIGKIFNSDFGLFYQVPMNSGALYKTTNVITTFVYRGLLEQGNIGMSSAAGFYQSVVGFVLVLATNQIIRRIDSENRMF